jgi:predicted enzyme related to lactoylglutathione lyase
MSLVVWFDLPVRDLDRAIAFYSAVLGQPVQREDYPNMSVGLFPQEDGEPGGCLFVGEVAENGPLLYFSVDGGLERAIMMAESYGGEILEPKHQIGAHGFRAVVRDSEGNRIALHSH